MASTQEKILSIIIPVRNWDIGQLLEALTLEISSLSTGNDKVEIIIADDYSKARYRNLNRVHVRRARFTFYYELDRNLGRAVIRNDLVQRATGRYLLFLDADVLPDNSNFLETYFACIRREEFVVCGGISYKQRLLDGEKYNFYLYKGKNTEWLPAADRQQVAWRYFFSANVLIRRSILDQISFDERFSGYGYEDIEWGIRLDRVFGIHQIDNSCSHLGLVEKQEAFLRMRKSMDNFMLLQKIHPESFHQTRVASTVKVLQKCPFFFLRLLDAICSAGFALSPWHRINLFCFQLDKAVLFAQTAREKEKNR